MSWEIIAATGEWAGAIAVVATLFYLARQVRQQNRIARTQVWVSVQSDFNQFNQNFVDNPDKSRIYQTGLADPDGLSDADAVVFTQLMRVQFNTALATFKAYQEGLVSEQDWLVWARWFAHEWYGTPGGSRWREINANVFPAFWEALSRIDASEPYGDQTFRRGYDRGFGNS